MAPDVVQKTENHYHDLRDGLEESLDGESTELAQRCVNLVFDSEKSPEAKHDEFDDLCHEARNIKWAREWLKRNTATPDPDEPTGD